MKKKNVHCFYWYLSEQDKENDSRNAQATQAVIQRRRRPKRRSTGVVHVDMDVSIFYYFFFIIKLLFDFIISIS